MSTAAAQAHSKLVLVAVDHSTISEDAFRFYIDYLHQDGTEVVLLHCPESNNVVFRLNKGEAPQSSEWQKVWDAEKAKWEQLKEKFDGILKPKNIKSVFETVPASSPGEVIVHMATERRAVMVVVGTRGMGTLRRTILGSVSDYVLHYAMCPVVVCHK